MEVHLKRSVENKHAPGTWPPFRSTYKASGFSTKRGLRTEEKKTTLPSSLSGSNIQQGIDLKSVWSISSSHLVIIGN